MADGYTQFWFLWVLVATVGMYVALVGAGLTLMRFLQK